MQKNGVFSQEEKYTLFISWGDLCLKCKAESYLFQIQCVSDQKKGNDLKISRFPALSLHYNILCCLKLSGSLQSIFSN